MALSSQAKRSYKKAVQKAQKNQRSQNIQSVQRTRTVQNVKRKRRKNKHWFFIRKGDSVKEVFSKIFTQLSAVVLIVCCVILIDYFKASFDNTRLNTTLQDLYGTVSEAFTGNGTLLPNAEKLLAINPDTVGWVKVDGTKIDLPVVLKPDDDQESYYYLTHNFEGNRAKAGALFIDYRTTITSNKQSDNLVIYGHNEADGTMFGELDKYKGDIEFYKQHPTISFNTNYETGTYKIVGMFVTNVLPSQDRNGVVFDYHNYIDMDQNRYVDFIGNVMSRTQVRTTVDTKFGDKFITLSTCSNEFEPSRFVVIARKVRNGEDVAVDTAGAVANQNALEPDWDYIYGR